MKNRFETSKMNFKFLDFVINQSKIKELATANILT